jgi:fumarate reductase subunit C
MGATMKVYMRPMPFAWWLRRRPYTFFVVRELTSLFIAVYAVVLLLLVRSLGRGPAAYQAFLEALSSPAAIAFHVVALAAALYHSVTWFRLAPMAVALRVGGRRVPAPAVVGANYAAWAMASLAIAWLLLRD